MAFFADRWLLLKELRVARRWTLTAIACALLVQGLLPAATAVAIAEIVVRVEATRAAALPTDVVVLLAAFGLALLLNHAIEAALQPLVYVAQTQVNGARRAELARLATAATTLEALERPRVQELFRSARAEPASWTERTPADGALAQLRLIGAAAGLLLSSFVLARYAWWTVPVLVVPAVASRIIKARQANRFIRRWRAGVPHLMHADVWERALISTGDGKDVRMFGLAEWMVGRIGARTRAMFEPVWAAGASAAVRFHGQLLVTAVPLVAVYALVARDTAAGSSSVAVGAAVLGTGWSVFQSVKYADIWDTTAGLESVTAYHQLRQVLDGNDAADTKPEPFQLAGPVRFSEVTFRYPGTERLVLDRLTLEIRSGELLAVVGVNGAGKSTLVKLLSGLYLPSGGQITAGGTDIRRIGLEAWRSLLFVAFQDFVKYPLSAAYNIALRPVSTPADWALLADAAARADIDDLIAALPAGWDTPLTRSQTGGVDLSGGQWQQIVLARTVHAILAGARLVVLDEPTAHLDVRTEFEVFRRITSLRRAHDLAMVLISHRLSTVRQADRIVLLDGGRITESGSHDALMARGGTYAELFTIQAERFRRGYQDAIDDGGLR